MRTSFHHQSKAQSPNGPLTAATSPDTPSPGPTTQSCANPEFPVSAEHPRFSAVWGGCNSPFAVSAGNEDRPEADWGPSSLTPEIRFPVRGQCRDQRLGSYPTDAGSHAGDWRLRIGKAEDPVLTRPLGRGIAEAGNSNPAWQMTFNGGFDQIWCEKGERDRHVDLAHGAFFARCDLLDTSHLAASDFIEPAPATGD